jgi:hypothetical protein
MQFWHDRRGRYLSLATDYLVEPNDLYFYLYRRPIRQLAWFRLSRLRLRSSSRLRESAMAALFGISCALALFKAYLVVGGHVPLDAEAEHAGASSADFIALGLLLVTTLSTALTSIYLSRNDRSLLHRYATQMRAIEDWLQRVLGRRPGGGSQAALPAAVPASQTQDILEFERLMVDELVDWIHISSHDTLELAP